MDLVVLFNEVAKSFEKFILVIVLIKLIYPKLLLLVESGCDVEDDVGPLTTALTKSFE